MKVTIAPQTPVANLRSTFFVKVTIAPWNNAAVNSCVVAGTERVSPARILAQKRSEWWFRGALS